MRGSIYHGDALGSVRHVTDESGDAIGSMRYSPFGQRVESTGLLPYMGFTGEPQDPSSDLTYLRARYYNPDLGRFLTADSIIPDPTNGQAWNRYAYVYNDVANLTDPSGMAPPLPDFQALWNSAQAWGNNLWQNGFHPGMNCECQEEVQGFNSSLSFLTGTLLPPTGSFYIDLFDRLFSESPQRAVFPITVVEKPHIIRYIQTYNNRMFPYTTHNLLKLRYLKPIVNQIWVAQSTYHFNSTYHKPLGNIFRVANSNRAGGVLGGAFQFLADIFDCSLSLPEQLLRGAVVGGQGVLLAGIIGGITVGGIGGVLLAGGVIIGGSIIFGQLNDRWLFPLINDISPNPSYL